MARHRTAYELLQQLADLRLIHLIGEEVSAVEGESCEAYMLDFGVVLSRANNDAKERQVAIFESFLSPASGTNVDILEAAPVLDLASFQD